MDNTSKIYEDHMTVRDKDGKLWHGTPEKIHEMEKAGKIKYSESVLYEKSDESKFPSKRWREVAEKIGIELTIGASDVFTGKGLTDESNEE